MDSLGAFMLMMLLPAPLLGPGEAERRLTLGICAAVGAAEIEQQVSDAEVQGGLAPLRIAQVFGTADAMAEQGRCRSREALNEAFDGFKAGRPDADELDKAFSHARLVARPPRGPSPGAPDRFEGTFLKLSGPRIPAVPQ